MQIVSDFEELLRLQFNEKFYVIENRQCNSYTFSSKHPKIEHGIIGVANNDHLTCKVFTKYNFKYYTFLTGEYESKLVGEILIKDLHEKIKSVTQVYFKEF